MNVVDLEPRQSLGPKTVRRLFLSGAYWLWPATLGLVAIIMAHTTDSLGGLGDASPIQDLGYFYGGNENYEATSDFPLTRDFVSAGILVVLWATLLVMRRQWRYMGELMTSLNANGVLVPLHRINLSKHSKFFRVDRLLGEADAQDSVAILASAMNRGFARAEKWHRSTFAFAAVVTAGLIAQSASDGVFQPLAPANEMADWAGRAYSEWWAALGNGPAIVPYTLMILTLSYLVLVQNIAGMIVVYGAIALPEIAQLDADWENRDGRYGWMPLFLVYRTVYASMAVQGFGISLLLVQFGLSGVAGLLAIPVALWLVALIVYVIYPFILYHRQENAMRDRRIQYLQSVLTTESWSPAQRPERYRAIVEEVARAHEMTLHPMGLKVYRFSPIIAVVVFPMGFTLAQIIFAT